MTRDAIVFRAAPTEPNPLADYEDLISRLDSTFSGSISKNPDQQVHLNQEETVLAFIKLISAALGSLSPLVAGLRTLLGLDAQIDPSKLLQQGKNEIVRERIESMQEFRQVLRELFKKKAGNQRVCIFLDDLDRCTPDIALDLLEAIKIFLGEVPCIFIVAADQHLIGQGLWLRFKDLMAGTNPTQVQAFFSQKGQEYFEKIIQMGIRVPDRTPAQTHRFITAQYPEWMAATDLIQVAIGSNPRRLKQYCNLLKYKYLATRRLEPDTEQNLDVALCNRIITINCWNPRCLDLLNQLAQHSNDYKAVMTCLEGCWQGSDDDRPSDASQQLGEDQTCLKLFNLVVESAPLLNLFKIKPFLSEAAPADIITFAQFADVAPNPFTIVKSRDRVFMRILEVMASQDVISPRKLIQDDLRRMIILFSDEGQPEIVELLHGLAHKGQWETQIQQLEEAIEQPDDTNLLQALGPLAKRIFDKADQLRKIGTTSDTTTLLLSSPRFSAILPQEIEMFWKIHLQLPQAEQLLSKALNPNPSAIEKGNIVAVEAMKLAQAEIPEVLAEIERSLMLRIQSAQYFLNLRKFAKIDALSHRWSELAHLFSIDYVSLIKLEDYFVSPQNSEGIELLWQRYQSDEQLARFFQLRPLFRDIAPDEVKQYLKVLQSVAQSPSNVLTTVVQTSEEKGSQTIQEALPVESFSPDYQDIIITIQKMPNVEGNQLLVGIRITGQEPVSEPIRLDEAKIDQMIIELREAAQQVSAQTVRAIATPFDLSTTLKEWGLYLFESIFTGQVRAEFLKRVSDGTNYRMLWELDDRMTILPLEVLFIPAPIRRHLALTWKYSLVRRISNVPQSSKVQLPQALRILAVFANPVDTPPLNIEEEEQILRRALGDGIQNRQIQLKVLGSSNADSRHFASLENLQNQLQIFQPHLLHFVGHGAYEEGQGSLILEDENRRGDPQPAEHIATILADSQIKLAILNACDTGVASQNDIITGAAGALINAGIPAVIATMRAVLDRTALLFTRNFYSSLSNGYDLERAIVEARKALSVENLDWSTYALFSGNTNLDDITFHLSIRSQKSAP